MAISIISSELKTVSGTITIPAGCDFVVALVSGNTNPTINSVAMTQDITAGVSISHVANPAIGAATCTIGQETRFVYLSGAGSVRDADGSPTGAAVTLDSSATDVVFGIQPDPGFGGGSLTVDGSTMTYLDTGYRGYLAAPDASVVCDGDGSANAFVSISTAAASSAGDGTMICIF